MRNVQATSEQSGIGAGNLGEDKKGFKQFLVSYRISSSCLEFLVRIVLEFSRICVYCIPRLYLFLYDVYFI